MSTNRQTDPTGSSSAVVYCKHGEQAAKRMLRTRNNKNREFYCCQRPVGDESRCNFWHWADDPLPLVASPSEPSNIQGMGSKTLTPQESSPRKQTPQSTRPASPVPTEVDELEGQQTRPYSFLGLHYSPEIETSAFNELPSTPPKKPRLTPPGEALEGSAPGSGRVGQLLTPPKTKQRITQFAKSPISATDPKGKGRSIVKLDDDQSPGDDALPLFADREGSSASSCESPTTAEEVLDFIEGMKTSVKAVSAYVDSFDIIEAMKTLQTVERQKFQYECRDRAQKKQIQELLAERDELRGRVTRLEALLRGYLD